MSEQEPEAEDRETHDQWLVHGLLQIEATGTSTSVVLRLQGEIDLNTAGQLHDEVMDRITADRRLVIDTSELTFCGSTGIAVFMEAHQIAQARAAQLRIVVPAGPLQRVLEAMGLADILPITPDLDTALR